MRIANGRGPPAFAPVIWFGQSFIGLLSFCFHLGNNSLMGRPRRALPYEYPVGLVLRLISEHVPATSNRGELDNRIVRKFPNATNRIHRRAARWNTKVLAASLKAGRLPIDSTHLDVVCDKDRMRGIDRHVSTLVGIGAASQETCQCKEDQTVSRSTILGLQGFDL